MRKDLKIIVIVLIATVILSQQPPLKSQAGETPKPVTADSIIQKINILKPKVDSINLLDSLKVYTIRMDSVKTDSKRSLKFLWLQQQKIISQMKTIDTLTKKNNEHQ